MVCPTCAATTVVPDDSLPPEGTRARCGNCSHVSIYYRGGLVADDPTPPQIITSDQMHQAGYDVRAGERIAAMPSIALAVPVPRESPPEPEPPPAAAGPAKSIGWQIRTAAGDQGPLPLDALKPMVRDGRLGPDDLACPPGEEAWTRAADLPDLQRWFHLQKKTSAGKPAAAADAVASCSRHPGVRGRWMCQGCGNLSCDSCVISAEVMRIQVKQCPLCRKACTEFVPSKKIVPFWEEIPSLLTYPFRENGWIALVILPILGICAAIAKYAAMAATFAWGAYGFIVLTIYAYHLYVIRMTTKGSRSLPNLGKVENYREELVVPAFKAAFVSIILFLPTLWTGSNVRGAGFAHDMAQGMRKQVAADKEEAEKRAADPNWRPPTAEDMEREAMKAANEALDDLASGDTEAIAEWMGQVAGSLDFREDRDFDAELREADRAVADTRKDLAGATLLHGIIVALLLFVWPIILIIVALFNTIVPAFQPQVLLKLIREIPREYKWCTVITSACFLAIFLLNLPVRHVAIVGNWLTSPLTYYFALIAAHVMGRTAELAEQTVDWH